MTVTEIAKSMMNSYRLQQKASGPVLKNGSLPPEGHVNPFEDPWMNITGKSPSEWQKTIPVDEGVAQDLRDLMKEDFVKRYGMCGGGKQADAQANIIKAYVAKLPGPERLAATYSCGQIARTEAERLKAIVMEHNPGWQWGQAFDTSILNEAPKTGLDIRA